MDRFFGLLGIILIFGIAFLMSNNRKAINYKTVGMGFLLQVLLAVFIFKVPLGRALFYNIGLFIQKILEFAKEGGAFVFGPLMHRISNFHDDFGKYSLLLRNNATNCPNFW